MNRNFTLTKIVSLCIFLCSVDSCKDQYPEREYFLQDIPVPKSKSFYGGLAFRWAPIHYQDVDITGTHGIHGRADYLSAVDFDNDWVATNNWINAEKDSLKGHCYYSVVETFTHWFIVYAFFHPRDWTDNWLLYELDEHENDLEGFLAIIHKDSSLYGSLHGIITVAHTDFFSFVPMGSSLQANHETIDGTLLMEHYEGTFHPVTAQEAKSHALKAWPYIKTEGIGVKYYPSRQGMAEMPKDANDRDVKYKLVDIFEPGGLWSQRNNMLLFANNAGVFKKTRGKGNANTPWNWDDSDDGNTFAGDMARDPAKLVSLYFTNLGEFSFTYLYNVYIGNN